MLTKHETPHGSWMRRSSLVMATAGAVIGLANFWRFPYLMAENGGLPFLLTYVFFLLLFALPLLYGEMLLGRFSRLSPIGGMRLIVQDQGFDRRWAWIGILGTLAALMTLALYILISGLTLSYVFKSALGIFNQASPDRVVRELAELRGNADQMQGWQMIFLLVVLVILARGVNQGIERAARLILPVFLGILTMLLTYALSQGDGARAWDYLLGDGGGQYGWQSVRYAAQHAFFSLGIGMGAMMVFGAYSPGRRCLLSGVAWVVGIDLLVSLLGGLIIYPLVFALGLAPTEGFDLLFRLVPQTYGQMPAGQFLAAGFFVLMTLVMWSSAIALGEPLTAWLIERFRMPRFLACVLVLSVAAVISHGLTRVMAAPDPWGWAGISLFSIYDVLVSGLLIPVTVFLIAWFLGRVMPASTLREWMGGTEPGWFFPIWHFLIRFAAPCLVVLLMLSVLAHFAETSCARSAEAGTGGCSWLLKTPSAMPLDESAAPAVLSDAEAGEGDPAAQSK